MCPNRTAGDARRGRDRCAGAPRGSLVLRRGEGEGRVSASATELGGPRRAELGAHRRPASPRIADWQGEPFKQLRRRARGPGQP